jgi:hypothetical protein
MTDTQVLTDAEIDGAYLGVDHGPVTPFIRYRIRAVERAVLAKCVKFTDGTYAVFRDGYPVIPEAEARERERRSWDAAVRYFFPRTDAPNGPHYWRGEVGNASVMDKFCVDGERDRRYPSLLPQSPSPLVLSTGKWTKMGNGYWDLECDGVSGGWTTPHIKTAADADALASWLRKHGER